MTDAAEQPPAADSNTKHIEDRVAVAVHVRPLIHSEVTDGCQECLLVTPGRPQVAAGGHSFTFDHVYGGGGKAPRDLYAQCVQPLVEGLFKGYNATVFAYGQTGSGKTYTMGSAFDDHNNSQHGVIPHVMATLFSRIAAAPDTTFTVRVGFVEIHQESIRDLLLLEPRDGGVHIRELPGGGIVLAGATEREISSQQEMVAVLQQGTHMRATASTEMNQRSSRSHAIFTITLEQRRLSTSSSSTTQPSRPSSHQRTRSRSRASSPTLTSDSEDATSELDDGTDFAVEEYLCAKLHLVDLAGSERVKRTKAQGQRLREGININKGLLALGNVISALSENKPHVPYRDSKLTRMLQDSLGGNSRTLMVACVSPADVNLEESINTLRYASRARNIRNKPVVNRDPVAAEIAHLRQLLAAARGEIGALKRRLGEDGEAGVGAPPGGEGEVGGGAVEELQQRIGMLELDNARLKVECETAKAEASQAQKHMIEAQAERDMVRLKLEEAAVVTGNGSPSTHQSDVLEQHLQHIAALEQEVQRLRRLQRISGSIMNTTMRAHGGPGTPVRGPPGSPSEDVAVTPLAMAANDMMEDGEDFAAEEQAYRLQQEAVQRQLETLQQALEAKEAQMARLTKGGGQVANLRQHYDKALKELGAERDALQRERRDLVSRLQALHHASEEERATLERRYRDQLANMDSKLRELQKRERGYAQLETLKARSEDACKRLQTDIQQIKQQKVALHRQLERANKEFQDWRKTREKEIMQLRAQGCKNAVQIQKLEALHTRQQAVLRRKTEEAEAARKRLKEVQLMRDTSAQSKEANARAASAGAEVECQPNTSAPLLRDDKARKAWVERELDACCAAVDLQRVLEGEKAQRSDAVRRLKDIEKQLAIMRSPAHTPLVLSSPLAPRVGPPLSEDTLEMRRAVLLERIARHSQQIVDLQQQLVRVRADEEARGGGAADAKRWNQLRSVVEARAMLKMVFRTASAHKAAAAEALTDATELREECELLRLKLEIAQQERDAARKVAAAAATAAAAIAGTGGGGASPGDSLGERPLGVPRLTTSVDAEVSSLLEAMEHHAGNSRKTTGRSSTGPLARTPSGDVMPSGDVVMPSEDVVMPSEDVVMPSTDRSPTNEPNHPMSTKRSDLPSDRVITEYDEAEDVGDSSSSSDDDDHGDVWDPQHATPARPRRGVGTRGGGGAATGAPKHRREANGSSHPFAPRALHDINARRHIHGLPPLPRLTKDALQRALEGCTVDGKQWRAGKKTKHDMINDYRMWLEEHAQYPALLGLAGGAGTGPTATAPPPVNGSRLGSHPLATQSSDTGEGPSTGPSNRTSDNATGAGQLEGGALWGGGPGMATSDLLAEAQRLTVAVSRLNVGSHRGADAGHRAVPMLRVVRSSPSSPTGTTQTYFNEGPVPSGSPSPLRRREAPLGGLLHARSLDSPLAPVPPPPADAGPSTSGGGPSPAGSPGNMRTRGGVYNMMAGVGSLWRQRLSRRSGKETNGVGGGADVHATPAATRQGGAGGGHTPETVYYLQQSQASRARSEALRAKIATQTKGKK